MILQDGTVHSIQSYLIDGAANRESLLSQISRQQKIHVIPADAGVARSKMNVGYGGQTINETGG
jgi:hypothetical protein